LIIEDDENNKLFSSLVEALFAFTFNDQPVQEKAIQQDAALTTSLSSPNTAYRDGAVSGLCLFKPSLTFISKSITSKDIHMDGDDDDLFEPIVTNSNSFTEGPELVQENHTKQDPPLPAFAKPGPSVTSTTASAAVTAAMAVPMDSKPTVTVTIPAGRAIARMRTKKSSVTPVVVMPTDGGIAKPRARARGLNNRTCPPHFATNKDRLI
jgi:hypothetical protein